MRITTFDFKEYRQPSWPSYLIITGFRGHGRDGLKEADSRGRTSTATRDVT